MRQHCEAFYANDDAATVIEYSLLASVVAIAAFAAIVNLGDVLEMMFGVVSNGVNNAI